MKLLINSHIKNLLLFMTRRLPSSIISLYKIVLFATLALIGYYFFDHANALVPEPQSYNDKLPTIYDSNLKVEIVFKGIKFPTSMAFLGPNDILVLEKNTGKVQRIINGTMLEKPLLVVNVDNRSERGLLGIAVAKKDHNREENDRTYVFLYYTEAQEENNNYCGSIAANASCVHRTDPLGNRVYRYELVNNSKLVNPKLLLDLPTKPGFGHIGGVTKIGPDNNIYLIIGDVRFNGTIQEEARFDGRSGILRITQDGQPVEEREGGVGGILGDKYPLNKYFAYGIRNSFGMDFDPLTANLWDTENGVGDNDEINLAKPGFNSGWPEVQGLASDEQEAHLEDFGGKGKYSDPEFVWNHTVAVTALKFLDSDKMGKKYENDMFVGDFKYGNLYHFDLNSTRTNLSLQKPLNDKIANNVGELENIILGKGFGGILDLEVGPDGYLYVLSIEKGQGGYNCRPQSPNMTCISYSSAAEGTIFRILPAADMSKAKDSNGG
jgi:glucose/arabinose dehydrogenase